MLTEGTKPLLADLHIDALALAWARRGKLLDSAEEGFGALVQWDGRMDASFRALQLLGGIARENLRARLKEPVSGKEAFVLARFGLAQRDDELLDTVVGLVQSLPAMREPLVAAVAWHGDVDSMALRFEALGPVFRLQVQALDAYKMAYAPASMRETYRWIAGQEPTPEIIGAALHLIRGVGDAHMARSAYHYINHEQSTVRLIAARTLVSLSEEDRPSAINALDDFVRTGASDMQEAALQALALHAPQAALAILSSGPGSGSGDSAGVPLRLAIKAHGWLGRSSAVPFLMSCLDDPAHARLAAAAIGNITGSMPVKDGWRAAAAPGPYRRSEPEGSFLPEADPDKGLPQPDREGFARWWLTNGRRFDPAATYLCGQVANVETLTGLLRSGPLSARAQAAERLQALRRCGLFPVGLPATRQLSLFHALP